MAEKIVESNLELNVLLQHWPHAISHAFRRFSAEARKKKTALTQEQLEQCAASLERTFPFYKRKFENEPENRLNFTKHFFAGACGFGSQYITAFPIDRDDIQILFGDSYTISFDECSREHSDDTEEKTILENAYFGDFVAAFRWLNIVFHSILDDSPNMFDAENMRCRFEAVLLLGYLMDKANQYDLQEYIQPTLAKETSNDPVLVKNLVQYYLDLHNPDYKKNGECTEEPCSLYATVLRETGQAYRMHYQPQRCVGCSRLYFGRYGFQEQYCSSDCLDIQQFWFNKFNNAQKSLKRSLKRQSTGEHILDNSCLEELIKSFTYSQAQKQYEMLTAAPNISDYYSTLFVGLKATNESKTAFSVRLILHDFLSSESVSTNKTLYENLEKALKEQYGDEDFRTLKFKMVAPIRDFNKKRYFTIY